LAGNTPFGIGLYNTSSRMVRKCDLGAWRRKKETKKRYSDISQVSVTDHPCFATSHQSCRARWGPERTKPC